MPTPNPLTIGNINLGLGGLGDELARQQKETDDERRRRMMQSQQGGGTADRLGLGAINILGGFGSFGGPNAR